MMMNPNEKHYFPFYVTEEERKALESHLEKMRGSDYVEEDFDIEIDSHGAKFKPQVLMLTDVEHTAVRHWVREERNCADELFEDDEGHIAGLMPKDEKEFWKARER